MRLQRLRTIFLILGMAAILSSDAADLHCAETLAEKLTAVTNLPRFKHAHWGLLVVDLATGHVVVEQNADKLFAPASTTKLYSVACALHTLGADYRFETPIHQRGTLRPDGELEGDLILVASGDLSFGGRTTEKGEIAFVNFDHTYANGAVAAKLTAPDPLAGLDHLARQVAKAGIKRVKGNVYIDDRLFEKTTSTGSGPTHVTPIMVNDNLIDCTIEPTEAEHPARVSCRPVTAAFVVEANCQTVNKDEKMDVSIHDLGDGKLRVIGRIPAGHRPVVRVYEVPNAAAFARTLLIEALQRANVTIDAKWDVLPHRGLLPESPEYKRMPVVAKMISPPFSESARLILKESHNLHASTLPLLVAAKHREQTLADGLHRQHEFLAKAGVDVDSISFGGGAGGARSDYITPRATIQLLSYMSKRSDFSVYYRALPSLGVDGTLTVAVKEDSPARNKVHAKTGTLQWENTMNGGSLLTSKALAGYMENSSGQQLAFAVFVNNVHLRDDLNAAAIGKDLGRLCEIIYMHKHP